MSQEKSEIIEKNLEEWLGESQSLPEDLWQEINHRVSQGDDVLEKIKTIRDILFQFYGKERGQAKNFEDSRFTAIDQMIQRGMISCGAMTNIFTVVLRKLGMPVKMIHGYMKSQDLAKGSRHSWIEIYDKDTGCWKSFDPTQKDFLVAADAVKTREYHNWEELKLDFEKGDY